MRAVRCSSASKPCATSAASAGFASSTRWRSCCLRPSSCWWWSSRCEPVNAHPTPERSALALLLLVAWAALIVYASWFPLNGWRWPAGTTIWALLALPWPRGQSSFDIVSNLLGYVPFGLLLVLAPGHRQAASFAALRDATALAAVLSYALEVGQHLLPLRVPSLLDWLL